MFEIEFDVADAPVAITMKAESWEETLAIIAREGPWRLRVIKEFHA